MRLETEIDDEEYFKVYVKLFAFLDEVKEKFSKKMNELGELIDGVESL